MIEKTGGLFETWRCVCAGLSNENIWQVECLEGGDEGGVAGGLARCCELGD